LNQPNILELEARARQSATVRGTMVCSPSPDISQMN